MTTTSNDIWDWALDLFRTPSVVTRTGIAADNVWQGDQIKIPRFPALCIEPGTRHREMPGAQRLTTVNTELLLLVYVGEVRDPGLNQHDAVVLGEKVETELHGHAKCGGHAIHSMVTEFDPGYATRSSVQLRAVRITFVALTRELLPAPVN